MTNHYNEKKRKKSLFEQDDETAFDKLYETLQDASPVVTELFKKAVELSHR